MSTTITFNFFHFSIFLLLFLYAPTLTLPNLSAGNDNNKGTSGGGGSSGDPDGWEVVGGARRGSHDRRPSR